VLVRAERAGCVGSPGVVAAGSSIRCESSVQVSLGGILRQVAAPSLRQSGVLQTKVV
jgi:hypothetical protein